MSYLITLALTFALVLLLLPFSDELIGGLHSVFSADPPGGSVGLLVSLSGGVVIFGYVAVTQDRRQKDNIFRYRRAELKLLELKKMERQEILDYHAQYNWDTYAGLSFSVLLVIASLLFTLGNAIDTQEEEVIVFVSLLLLAVSSVALMIVDLFHTNTLSPLITAKKRFELVVVTIKIGSAAIILQVCGISSFLALINSWLSVFVSLVAVVGIVFFSGCRGVPLAALKSERNLSDEDGEEIRDA
jgi:hypothetical protein